MFRLLPALKGLPRLLEVKKEQDWHAKAEKGIPSVVAVAVLTGWSLFWLVKEITSPILGKVPADSASTGPE